MWRVFLREEVDNERTKTLARSLVRLIRTSKRIDGHKCREERQEEALLIEKTRNYTEEVLVEVATKVEGGLGEVVWGGHRKCLIYT